MIRDQLFPHLLTAYCLLLTAFCLLSTAYCLLLTAFCLLLPLCPLWLKASFPGAVIDGVGFVDCIFRGVRFTEVMEASGSILFRSVKIEPAEKGRSLNSRPTWP